jgi:cephalosporin hydroxylase
MEALEHFLAMNPGVFVADREREQKFGYTAAPSGYLIRA